MSREWQWYWGEGAEPERYHLAGAAREEAIAAATRDAIDTRTVTICEGMPQPLRDDFFSADNVLDAWHEYNDDLQDEDGELGMDPTHEQKQELEKILNAAFKAWRENYKLGRAWPMDTRSEEIIDLPDPEWRKGAA